jgi:hypothetical protein
VPQKVRRLGEYRLLEFNIFKVKRSVYDFELMQANVLTLQRGVTGGARIAKTLYVME